MSSMTLAELRGAGGSMEATVWGSCEAFSKVRMTRRKDWALICGE